MISLKKMYACLNLCAALFLLIAAAPRPSAQDETSRFRVNVDLVQLTVAVTDSKGNYVTNLRPEDFIIMEDNIPQKLATFEEGSSESVREQSMPAHPEDADPDVTPPETIAGNNDSDKPAPSHTLAGKVIPGFGGANVYILFDTSNYMYRGFVFAQDAIADFIRAMPDANKIAFYSYSRDLSRSAALTKDRFQVVNGVRSTVAGDDAALYNSLLLTVKDAAPLQGRKAIVVFSNGPDNASSVPPEDVAELAQSTGTIIYIVSTRQAESEPVSAAAFERMSKATGGKAYFARNWRQEKDAFSSIQQDLSHLYTLSYYPQTNPNRGWRAIKVRLVGKDLQKDRIRTRDGYSLMQQVEMNNENNTASVTAPEQK